MLLEVGRHLKFFDKDGNELNLRRAYGVWYGLLYFPTASVNLYEGQHLFVVEEVKYKQIINQSIDTSELKVSANTDLILELGPDPSNIESLSKVYYQGQRVTCKSDLDPDVFFIGEVKGYNYLSGELFLKILYSSGLGADTTWNIESIVNTYPRGTDSSIFSFSWREPSGANNLILYNTVFENGTPVIKKDEEAIFDLDNGSTDDIEGVTFSGSIPISVDDGASLYRVIQNADEIDSRVLKINLALISKEESRFARTLEMFYVDPESQGSLNRNMTGS